MTRAVLSGRYEVGIGAGGFTGLRVRVLASGHTTVGASQRFSIVVSSEGNPGRRDTVRGVVTVAKTS